MFFSAIIFIFTLLVLVLIHELGHFLVAKKFGIKVEEFGFGIPPRAWGKKIGETIYSINWLPLGGFVRLLGEDEAESTEVKRSIKGSSVSRYFSAKPVWERIAVVFAGVMMNFILAWILFYIVLAAKGFKFEVPLIIDHHFIGAEERVEAKVFIAQVASDSPASQVGLKQGEEVIALNNEPVVRDSDLVQKIKNLSGHEVKLTIKNPQDNSTKTVGVTPRQNPPQGQGPLGVALVEVRLVNLEYKTPTQKLLSGITHSYNVASYSLRVLGTFIKQAFIKKDITPLSQSVAGPVGITSLANSVLTSSDKPLIPYLDFMAMLSLNLAVMNLLPIPALDGGRLFFLLIEAFTKRKVRADVEKWVHTFGMALLLALTLLITLSDIKKLLP